MIVHVLTPVTRPENIPAVSASLLAAAKNAPSVTLQWHLSLDLEQRYVCGWRLRNAMLNRIEYGWIWLLDDDTEAHPNVLARLEQHADAAAIVFSQGGRPESFPPGVADPARLANGDLREKLPANASVFDTGMTIFRYDLVRDYEFREHRAADGYFWDEVLSGAENVVYLKEVLCTYNSLRAGEWG
jgi:hypothetical protein